MLARSAARVCELQRLERGNNQDGPVCDHDWGVDMLPVRAQLPWQQHRVVANHGLFFWNIAMLGLTTTITDTKGRYLLGVSAKVDTWVLGPVSSGSADISSRSISSGSKIGNHRRDSGS